MAGPLFQTMFTIVSICKEIDNDDIILYVAQTEEGSEILAGRYKEDGHFGVQVTGPIGASPYEYDGPEAQKVFASLEADWNEAAARKV